MRRALIAALIAVAATSTSAAGRPWRMIRGASVVVVGQQSPRTLRDVAVQIEQFRLTLGSLIKSARQPLSTPTLVMAFDDYEAMKPFVPLYQGKPVTIGGLCYCGGSDDPSVIAVSLAGFQQSSAIIFHEYAHLLIHNGEAGLPVWLDEGLAEYFSTFQLRSGASEAIIGGPIDRHLALLRERFMPLAELLSVDRRSPMYNESSRQSIFYAESWALTQFLMVERAGGLKALGAYLEAKDATPETLVTGLGTTMPALEQELRNYVHRPAFTAMKYALRERIEVDAPEQARTLDAAEADARLGELQIRVGRVDEAAARIEAAAKAGAGIAEAQLALGLLRVGQHRPADSLQALEKAATLAPDDFLAQYLYGITLLREATDLDQSVARPTHERAHGALARAAAVKPDSAAAHAWTAYADMLLDARWEEARDETTARAMKLAPGRLDYQLQMALIYLRREEMRSAARAMLRSLEAQTSQERVAQQARSVLAQMAERERLGGPLVAAPPSGPARAVNVGPGESKVEEHPDTGRKVLGLRKVREGEARALGELVSVGCSPSTVQFIVLSEGRTIVASAAKMQDVDLVSFLDDKDFGVACGEHPSRERVYVTWRSGAATSNGIAGTAVAVEFLPKTYIP